MKNEMNNFDVIIIGAGPAGMTAAMYLRRAMKSVLLVEKECYGGQMAKAPRIENYPGWSGSGYNLADEMFKPIEQDVEFVFGEPTKITREKNKIYSVVINDVTYIGQAIIWAIGCETISLNVPGVKSTHVHYCVTCDGPLYINKDVVVIGDGNSAMQYAYELMGYANVTLLTLTNKLFGEQKWIDRITQLSSDGHITWIQNWNTIEFKHEEDSDDIVVRGKVAMENENKEYDLSCDGVFIAIGQKPHNDLLKTLDIPLSPNGYVIALNENLCVKEGFYVAGDCRLKDFRQVSLACADGVTAALNVIEYLNEKDS